MLKKRNAKIDLLKFIMSLVIMVHHSRWLLGDDISPFLKGSFAVEFFFITSGYLLMLSCVRDAMEVNDDSASTKTLKMLKRQFMRMNPELLFAFIIGCIVLLFTKYHGKTWVKEVIVHSWTQPIGLSMTGMDNGRVDGVLWYISTLLIAQVILYPIILKYGKNSSKIWAPLVGCLLIGFLKCQYGG